MSPTPVSEPEHNAAAYLKAFKGEFRGMLRWEQLEELWGRIRDDAAGGWYVYAVGEPPPDTAFTAEALMVFIKEVDALLRAEHKERYCGIVYADDAQHPAFVKIYDPNNLGVSCGSSKIPPLPGWVLSKLPPVDLPSAFPQPNNRRRWWRRIIGA